MAEHVITFYARSEALRQMYQRATKEQRRQIAAAHATLEVELRDAQATVAPGARPGIALGLHQLVDQAVADQLAARTQHDVKCHRGCDACCRLHVVVTEHEATVAVMAASDAGWTIDLDRARVQAEAPTAAAWERLSDDDRRCVFLTNAGECAIYEYRPVACRKYMVVSPPEDCDSIAKPGHRVLQLYAPHAEIAFSASLQVFESGTLAAMVLAAAEEESTP